MPFSLGASNSEPAEGTLPRCLEEEVGTQGCLLGPEFLVCAGVSLLGIPISPHHTHCPTQGRLEPVLVGTEGHGVGLPTGMTRVQVT